jgi:SAM-dependent methyltransferase
VKKYLELTWAAQGKPTGEIRGLDMGCAVGRSTFELARFCDHVTGMDFSKNFIDTCRNLQEKGRLNFLIPEEGEISREISIDLEEERLDASIRKKIFFAVGDACRLEPKTIGGPFHAVLASNLVKNFFFSLNFFFSTFFFFSQFFFFYIFFFSQFFFFPFLY